MKRCMPCLMIVVLSGCSARPDPPRDHVARAEAPAIARPRALLITAVTPAASAATAGRLALAALGGRVLLLHDEELRGRVHPDVTGLRWDLTGRRLVVSLQVAGRALRMAGDLQSERVVLEVSDRSGDQIGQARATVEASEWSQALLAGKNEPAVLSVPGLEALSGGKSHPAVPARLPEHCLGWLDSRGGARDRALALGLEIAGGKGMPGSFQPVLRRAARDDSFEVRSVALLLLAELFRDPTAIKPLMHLLGVWRFVQRPRALRLLVACDRPESIDFVVRALQDPEDAYRAEAWRLLEKLPVREDTLDEVQQAWKEAPTGGRVVLLQLVSKVPGVEPGGMIAAALHDPDDRVARKAYELLLARAAADVPRLRLERAAAAGQARRRILAIRVLERMGAEEALRLAIQAHGDPEVLVREEGMRMLAGRELRPADLEVTALAFRRAPPAARLSLMRKVDRIRSTDEDVSDRVRTFFVEAVRISHGQVREAARDYLMRRINEKR